MKETTYNDIVILVLLAILILLWIRYTKLHEKYSEIESYIDNVKRNNLLYLICEVQQTSVLHRDEYNQKLKDVVQFMHKHEITDTKELFDYNEAIYTMYLNDDPLGNHLYSRKNKE